MFCLGGDALITGTVASDATYTLAEDIETRIANLGDLVDIDGNGQIDALTDGLLTLRYLFGLEGETLVAGVVAADATRTTSEIEAHLKMRELHITYSCTLSTPHCFYTYWGQRPYCL